MRQSGASGEIALHFAPFEIGPVGYSIPAEMDFLIYGNVFDNQRVVVDISGEAVFISLDVADPEIFGVVNSGPAP
jgi:hypothetical protein